MSKNQRELIPVIIIAALWLLTTCLAIVFYVDWQEKESQIRSNKSVEADARKNVLLALDTKIVKLERLVGFSSEEEEGVDVKLLMSKLNEIIRSGENAYGLNGLGTLDKMEIKEELLASFDYPINVQFVLQSFEDRIRGLKHEEADNQKGIEDLKWDIDNEMVKSSRVKSKQEEIIASLDKEYKDVEDKYQRLLKRVQDKKNEAESEKNQAEEKRLELQKEMQSASLDFENRLIKKKNEIRGMQAAKYGRTSYSEVNEERPYQAFSEKSDGEVVYGDPLSRNVYISLGKQSGVFRGLKFDIYRQGEKGTKQYRGRVEITKVMDNVSTAVVIENTDELDPIVSGDMLINPIFNREKPIYLTYAGRFSKVNGSRGAQEITRMGGKVESKVSARTNFVVVADDKGKEHKNYLDAKKFKIPVMTEQILLRYIGQ